MSLADWIVFLRSGVADMLHKNRFEDLRVLSTLPYIPSFHWLCCEKQHYYEVVWPTISCEYDDNDFDSWQQGPLFIIIIIIVLLFVNEEEY